MATVTPQHASAQNMGAGLPAYSQTQPSACQNPPPPDQSPTPLEKVKSTITQMRKGSYLQGNIEIDNLTAADFQRIRFELSEEDWGFFQDKVRYAYTNNKLFITIPSGPQELASHKLANLIQTTLKQHRHDSTWGPFLRDIQSMGSTNFDLDGVTSRTPNECWQHTSAKWPGVVVEVQFTKREYPEKQAYDWLVRSRNNIKVLIIVILPLTLGDDSFTVQTWKSQYRDHVWSKKLVSKNITIVDSEGCMNGDHPGIELLASDFACHKSLSEAGLADAPALRMLIRATDLFQALKRVHDYLLHPGQVSATVSESGTFESPPVTPGRELVSDDERKQQEAEDGVEKRAEEADR